MEELSKNEVQQQLLTRRNLLRGAAAAMAIPAIARATSAFAKEKLAGSGSVVVFSYGGSWTAAMRRALFDPFTEATSISVTDVVADYSEAQIKAMHQAGRVDWDVAYIDAYAYPAMRDAGMFEPINYSMWEAESLEGAPKDTRLKDAVVAFETGLMMACDTRAFPKGAPKSWAEFWDVKAFPGPRGLIGAHGERNLSPALRADGVAPSDIWPMTDEKIDRALKKLDQIKPSVAKWWTAGGEPIQLLTTGEYAATLAPTGRCFVAVQKGVPLSLSWDGASISVCYWVVLKGGPNTENAQKLIAFGNRARIAANLTQGLGSPGPNRNQLKYIPRDVAKLLSIAPENASKAVRTDDAWLADKRSDRKTNADHLQERWLAWRA